MSKPNERSCRVLGNSFLIFAPPCYSGGLQNGITFFLLGPCWVLKSMLDKSFHFVCFPKHFRSLSVSHPFTPFFQRILVGNRQTKKFSKKWNVCVFKMLLHTVAVPKASNWSKLWLFKYTCTLMMGEMEKFPYFFKKSSNLV